MSAYAGGFAVICVIICPPMLAGGSQGVSDFFAGKKGWMGASVILPKRFRKEAEQVANLVMSSKTFVELADGAQEQWALANHYASLEELDTIDSIDATGTAVSVPDWESEQMFADADYDEDVIGATHSYGWQAEQVAESVPFYLRNWDMAVAMVYGK